MQLSPRDWFSLLRHRTRRIGININTDALLVEENPDRVLLIIANPSSTGANVWPEKMTTVNNGILVQNTLPQLEISHETHGKLVGMEWHGYSSGTTTLNIIELILDFVPGKPRYNLEDLQRAVAPQSVEQVGSAGGVGGVARPQLPPQISAVQRAAYKPLYPVIRRPRYP